MLKNMKIRSKLILAVVAITLLTSAAGIISLVTSKGVNNRYDEVLVRYGFAQGDVGRLLACFVRINGDVHDAIGYTSVQEQRTARQNVEAHSQSMAGYFDAVEVNLVEPEAIELFQKARKAWDAYQALASELVAEANSTDSSVVMRVQQRLIIELDPYYLEIYDALNGLMDVKVNAGEEAQRNLNAFENVILVVIVGVIALSVVVALVTGTRLARGIAKPITLCSERLKLLAQGNLRAPVPEIHSRDEAGELAVSTETIVKSLTAVIRDEEYLLREMANGNFNISSIAPEAYIGDFEPLLASIRDINSRLSDTLSQINQASDLVAAGSNQVSSGAQSLSQGATQQASSVEELAATIAEISTQVNSNAQFAKNAAHKVEKVGKAVAESNGQMQQLMSAMADISGSSAEIGKIIKTIEDIAFQTNILALNAAVEAARAGAAGRGFAVVADEVRNLANKSAEASKNTSALIERSIQAIGKGTETAGLTNASLSVVVEGAREVTSIIDKISDASDAQATSLAQVTAGVDQIASVVQTNSATAQESAAASEELSGQARLLKELVGRFHLREHESQTGLTYEYIE